MQRSRFWTGLAVMAGVALTASWAQAQDLAPGAVDSGDTAWMLVSTALVMLMTPGLAFFYGGLVRRKNVLSVLMQCMMALCLISVQWVLVGYTLSFGPGGNGFIGGLEWLGLEGVGLVPNDTYAKSVPHQSFMIFQMMFAIITPALIIGAFAERIRFSAFCVFSLLWATLVYNPVCHWVWGEGGFLRQQGVLDFAGGIVVHVNAGLTALAAAIFLGRRKGYPHMLSPPHNLPFAVLGAALLWFGWFGFNAGSALASNMLAASAFVATHIAGAVAGLVWSALDWWRHGKPTVLGMITGIIAGLAAVTPAAGFVTPIGSILIGALSGVICWCSVTFVKSRLAYDDSLDAFGVHGVGGIWGSIAVGIWATTDVNPAGANGLLYGNPGLLWIQTKAVLITAGFSLGMSLVLFVVVNAVLRLRVDEHDERVGLDLTQHREAGYTVVD